MTEPSYIDWLGARISRWEENFCEWVLEIQPRHLNPQGALHGGVISTLLDEACGFSGFFQPPGAPPVGRSVTVSLSINFMGPARSGKVYARGHCMGGGTRIYFAEGKLVNEDGSLIAQAAGSFRRRMV